MQRRRAAARGAQAGRWLTGLPRGFYELYGLTEGFVTILDRDAAATKLGSVGVPPPGYELRVLDENATGAPARAGRRDRRSRTDHDAWLLQASRSDRRSDQGWVAALRRPRLRREDGFLFLVDRKKDLIVSGGVNVYPRDIEEIVVCHPAVADVAVFGVPHERWGETPVAAVVLRSGMTATPEAIQAWVNERVSARFQKIDAVRVVDALPRNVAGKTLRRVLQQMYFEERKS